MQGVCKVAIDPFDNPYLKPIFSGLSNWYVCQYVGSTEYGGYQFSGSLMAGLVGPKPLVQVINYYDNYDFMYRTNLRQEMNLDIPMKKVLPLRHPVLKEC